MKPEADDGFCSCLATSAFLTTISSPASTCAKHKVAEFDLDDEKLPVSGGREYSGQVLRKP